VLEHLLFACCLENASYEAAEKAFQALKTGFFDWNEVRVSSVRELAEAVPMLPDALSAATNVKRLLYSIFESAYSFDLENLKKQNLGQAIQKLKKYEGATPFVVAYATQVTLGGHAIPLDRGTLEALVVVGLIDEREASEGHVPGMERAVPKNKGIEYGSILHQLGAETATNPYSPALHKLFLEIAPDAKDRLPKRKPKAPPAPPPSKVSAPKGAAPKPGVAAPVKPGAPPVKPGKEPPKTAKPAVPEKKKPGVSKPAAPEKPAVHKPAAKTTPPPRKPEPAKAEHAKHAADAKKAAAKKKPPAPAKKPATLPKRKPR
jgi:endonuclease-3